MFGRLVLLDDLRSSSLLGRACPGFGGVKPVLRRSVDQADEDPYWCLSLTAVPTTAGHPQQKVAQPTG